MANVHTSPYAGTWYPGDAGELREAVREALEASRRRNGPYLLPNPIAFVVPHAGLMYSGSVAAAAYRHIQAHPPRRIVVLGFSHSGSPAGIAIPEIDGLATPLGTTRVDREAAIRLLRHPGFQSVAEEQVCDHSVEIQLPFLQYAAPETVLLPLYVGSMPAWQQEAAAQALAELAGDDTLLVASSDLTHFGRAFGYEPFPADGDVAEKLADLDRGAMEDAGSLDAALFLEGLRDSGATVCGRAPIALLLWTLALRAGAEVFQQTLDYQTSGEITGDYGHSVSYGALGYFPAPSFELGAEDAARLLESARRTLAQFLRSGRRVAAAAPATPALTRQAGVFVTLHEQGKLRGCVGVPGGRGALAQAVGEMALSAALDDPRFEPLGADGGEIEIEISLLSPMKRIRSREAYRAGEHGAHLEAGVAAAAAGGAGKEVDGGTLLGRPGPEGRTGSGGIRGWADAAAHLSRASDPLKSISGNPADKVP
jgi:AmmeMemoRadiSam system protein B